MPTAMPLWSRLLVAIAVGLFGALLCRFYNPAPEAGLVDLSWSFNAARDLLAGRDPYRHAPSVNLIPYPLPAALVVMPFALLPGPLGIYLLFGLASGLLAFGMLREGQLWSLFTFVSPAFTLAAWSKQWSPLLMAALFYPWLSFVLVAKPTLAPPIVLSAPWTRRSFAVAAAIGTAIVGVSFLLIPDWPWRWLAQVGEYSGFVPLLALPAGPLLALALLRLRERRARLLLLCALVPQQTYVYDQLLLWAVPRTLREMLLLTVISWVALQLAWAMLNTLYGAAQFILLGIYAPALLMVLLAPRSARADAQRV